MDMLAKHTVLRKGEVIEDRGWIYPMFDAKNNPVGTLLKVGDPDEWISIHDLKYDDFQHRHVVTLGGNKYFYKAEQPA